MLKVGVIGGGWGVACAESFEEFTPEPLEAALNKEKYTQAVLQWKGRSTYKREVSEFILIGHDDTVLKKEIHASFIVLITKQKRG